MLPLCGTSCPRKRTELRHFSTGRRCAFWAVVQASNAVQPDRRPRVSRLPESATIRIARHLACRSSRPPRWRPSARLRGQS